MAMAQAE
jgi:hypothetical protein